MYSRSPRQLSLPNLLPISFSLPHRIRAHFLSASRAGAQALQCQLVDLDPNVICSALHLFPRHRHEYLQIEYGEGFGGGITRMRAN